MATNVKVKIDADGTGFHKVMGGVKSSVAGLGASLKGALVGAIGVGTLGFIAKEMLNFGDEVRTIANNFDISTDAAQRFMWAARNANVEVETMGKGIRTLDKAMSEAKGGDKNKMDLLKRLGFSEKDFDMAPDQLFTKMLSNSKSRPRNVTESILNQIGMAPKLSGKIMGAREDILNGDVPVVSEKDINSLDALGDGMQNLWTIIKVSLIPALLMVAKSFLEYMKNKGGTFETWARQKNEMARVGAEDGKSPNGFRYAWEISKFGARNLARTAGHGFSYLNPWTDRKASNADNERIRKQIGDLMYINLYGAKGFSAGREKMTKDSKNIFSTLLKPIDDMLEQLNKPPALNNKKPYVREAIKEPPVKVTATQLKDIGTLGTNEFMKIGGALGIDAKYRMERLTIQANNYLSRTATAVENIDKKLSGTTPQEYPPSEG